MPARRTTLTSARGVTLAWFLDPGLGPLSKPDRGHRLERLREPGPVLKRAIVGARPEPLHECAPPPSRTCPGRR